MSENKADFPESGDLVIATIESVMDYGDMQTSTNTAEASSTFQKLLARIRNIRDFVRENQKLVLKVVRIDTEKGHIDLSLRRVTKRERIEKIKSWKKERKGETLLHAVAEKVGVPIQQLYQTTGAILEERFGLYEAFERTVKEGSEFLIKAGVPEDVAKVITHVAEERIKIKMVKVRGVLEVRCMKPNGVRCIKEVFNSAMEAQKAKDAKVEFAVVAAPKYSVEVSADSWKRAEEVLDKVSTSVVSNVTKLGGHGEFKREK